MTARKGEYGGVAWPDTQGRIMDDSVDLLVSGSDFSVLGLPSGVIPKPTNLEVTKCAE